MCPQTVFQSASPSTYPTEIWKTRRCVWRPQVAHRKDPVWSVKAFLGNMVQQDLVPWFVLALRFFHRRTRQCERPDCVLSDEHVSDLTPRYPNTLQIEKKIIMIIMTQVITNSESGKYFWLKQTFYFDIFIIVVISTTQ